MLIFFLLNNLFAYMLTQKKALVNTFFTVSGHIFYGI